MSNERSKDEFYSADHGDEDSPEAAQERVAEAERICEAKRLRQKVRIADWYLDMLRGAVAGGVSRGKPGHTFSQAEDLLKKAGEGETFPIYELGYSKHGLYTSASARRFLDAIKNGYEAWVKINKNTSAFGTITDDIYCLPLRAVEIAG